MSDSYPSWECVAELKGHSSWIYGVAMISDKLLASVSGRNILLWNLKTQEVDFVLEGHEGIIFSISLSPDKKLLASGGLDKTICLWDLEQKRLICKLAKRRDPIYSVAFSPDGKLLASGGENKYKSPSGQKTTIYIWDVEKQELKFTLSKHSLRIGSLSFSSDGSLLVSSSNDNTSRVWDMGTGEQLYVLEGCAIGGISSTPNGNRLVGRSGSDEIKIWDAKTGEFQKNIAEKFEYIGRFDIDPSGRLIAFDIDHGIEVWNIENNERVGYVEFKWPVNIQFSNDGKFLMSGDASAYSDGGGLVRVWKVPGFDLEIDLGEENYTQLELIDIRNKVEAKGYFDVENIEDARERILASIVQRQGQSEFRQQLIKAYGGQCAITGCNVEQALEAAHIIPYQGIDTNHLTNGLLLRADIHTLFDLYLLSIYPDTYSVVISPKLMDTCYQDFAGCKLNLPTRQSMIPSHDALNKHYKIFICKYELVMNMSD